MKKKLTVAFQGKKGAYSEQAAFGYFGEDITPYGFDYSEEVISALEDEETEYAILPIENSIVGHVDVNQDLLINDKLVVIGETYLHIHHHLLGVPGALLDDITEVHSHPIALGQCKDFLKRHKIEMVPDFDTAGASRDLLAKNKKHIGTISSKLCTDYYGLEVIHDRIQKVKNNYTRFLVITKKNNLKKPMEQEKTSMAMGIHHDPGSLANCLSTFARFEINLTKLESRPIADDPFNYIFYIDFLEGLTSSKAQECLKELEKFTSFINIIGSYPLGNKEF